MRVAPGLAAPIPGHSLTPDCFSLTDYPTVSWGHLSVRSKMEKLANCWPGEWLDMKVEMEWVQYNALIPWLNLKKKIHED